MPQRRKGSGKHRTTLAPNYGFDMEELKRIAEATKKADEKERKEKKCDLEKET
jgi:hypothetical protein